MSLYSNIVYKGNRAYQIIDIIKIHMFLNSDNSVNERVLGMYVHEKGGDHVLQRDRDFLICVEIPDAEIVGEAK